MGDFKLLKDKYKNISENEVVRIARTEDPAAQEYLIRKYMRYVQSKAKMYFLVGASKEDVIQEGMIGIFKAIKSFDETKNVKFSTFVNLCISRQIITAIKRANRQKHVPLNSYISLHKLISDDNSTNTLLNMLEQDDVIGPEEAVITKEQRYMIKELTSEVLSDLEAKIFVMYLEGISYKKISLHVNKNAKAVDNALQRIRKKLEGHLNIIFK